MTSDEREKIAKALNIGKHMMDSSRKANAEYEKRTGQPSRISERDYLDGEDNVAVVALKYWGIGERKARRLIREFRAA